MLARNLLAASSGFHKTFHPDHAATSDAEADPAAPSPRISIFHPPPQALQQPKIPSHEAV